MGAMQAAVAEPVGAPVTSVVYAAPPAAGSVVYAQAPSATVLPAAGSVTYAAPTVTYAAPTVTYAAPAAGSVTYAAAEPVGQPVSTMTYAAPATYSAPIGGQPVYTISPERFQLILQGQPLTNEEIAAMTGQAAAPIATQAGQSFVMPDMFASPGLTMVGGQQGEFNQQAASASTVAAATTFEPTAAPVAEPAAAKASSKKKSDKKSSK